MTEKTFELKPEHLLLLKRLEWMSGDYGTPETDQKRPYGNSGGAIACDIADILEWPWDRDEGLHEPDRERAMELFGELSMALKVILENCSVEPGLYFKPHREAAWEPKL